MTRREQLLQVLAKTCEPNPPKHLVDEAIKKLRGMKIIQAAIKMDSDLQELRENAIATSKRFLERAREIYKEGGVTLHKKVQWDTIQSHKFDMTIDNPIQFVKFRVEGATVIAYCSPKYPRYLNTDEEEEKGIPLAKVEIDSKTEKKVAAVLEAAQERAVMMTTETQLIELIRETQHKVAATRKK